MSTVTIVGADKIRTKVTTNVKSHVNVTAKPSNDVLITSDNAPNVVTVQGFDKEGNLDGKPRKVHVKGFNVINDQLTIGGGGQPLFIIDGKEVKSVNNLNPNDIETISVLKDGAAEKKYGEKGKNGVIAIVTKKGK